MPTEFLGVPGLADEPKLTLGDAASARTDAGLALASSSSMSRPAPASTLARINSSGGATTTTGGATASRARPGQVLE